MTNEEVELAQVLSTWVAKLGLSSWRIAVHRDDTLWERDQSAAQIRYTTGRAVITWSRKLFEHTETTPDADGCFSWDGVEGTVLHELLHLLTAEINTVASSAIAILEDVSADRAKLLKQTLEDTDELLVARLLHAFLDGPLITFSGEPS